jgi:predicted RND superfamily exporter protein
MTIRIEQIDELVKRANVSYEDAKGALEKCGGDMVEALIYLERNKKIKKDKNTLFDKMKDLFKKGNDTRFIIKKRESVVLNLSVNISILIAIFAFHVTAFGLVLALLCGFKMKFETDKGEELKVNQTLDKMQDNIQDIKNDILRES